MSFYLSQRAATKAALLANLSSQLDAIVVSQPVHGRDIPAVKEAVAAHVNLLDEPAEGNDIQAVVSGSIGTVWDGNEAKATTSASLQVTVSYWTLPLV